MHLFRTKQICLIKSGVSLKDNISINSPILIAKTSICFKNKFQEQNIGWIKVGLNSSKNQYTH